jgi:hypothetical protein
LGHSLLGDTTHLEDTLDHPGGRGSRGTPPIGPVAGVPRQQHPHAGGVQEAHAAEIEHESREPNRLQLGQLVVDQRDGREVELGHRTDPDHVPVRLDIAPE